MIVQLSPGLDERDDLRQKILNPWLLCHCRKRRLTRSLSFEEGRDVNPNRTSLRQKNLLGCLPGYFTSRSQLIPQTGSTPHFPGASTAHQATWSKQTAGCKTCSLSTTLMASFSATPFIAKTLHS